MASALWLGRGLLSAVGGGVGNIWAVLSRTIADYKSAIHIVAVQSRLNLAKCVSLT